MPSYQIQQLATFCREHPVEPKVVFVPSVQAGTVLGATLARTGTDWVNLRFTTPEDAAREIAEPSLIAAGWSALPKDADLIELAPIVRAFLADPDNDYFSNQRFSQGLLRSIHRTVRALRIAGTSAETLLRQRNPKLRAVARLYVAYQDCLERKRWYDGPDLFATAVSRIERAAPRPAVYAILDETPMPGLASEFVRTLTGGKLLRVGRGRYGVPVPDTVAAARFADRSLVDEASTEPAAAALDPDSDVIVEAGVELRTAAGPEIELRSALARILREGWSLDTVELVCAAPDGLNDAYATLRKLGIPATFGAGVPILLTRPGQALRSALRWVESGGDPRWLVALQSGRLLNVDAGSPADLPPALADLGALVDAGSTSAADLALLGARLLTEHVSTLAETEAPARDSLVTRLEELARVCETTGQPREIAAALLDVVANHRFEALTPRAGHLNVVTLDRAGFAGREHVFVTGLDGTSFPGAPGEDPLLLDHERSQLSDSLEMLRTRPITQTWHMARLLGLAPRPILSASVFRLADGQESEPSSLFLHLADRLNVTPQSDTILPAPDEDAPEAPALILSWAKAGGAADGLRPLSPWLFDGARAEHERRTRPFTPFKGTVGPAVAPDEDAVWSASRLETLARCPYRYYWRYVLEIEPPEEEGIDPTRWLTPLEYGSLLHKLFQRFMAARAEIDRPPDPAEDWESMMDLLAEIVDRTARDIPPPNPMAFEVDRARLETAARVFLAEESRRPPDHRPRGFEVSFGFDDTGGLNHPAPIVLDLGGPRIRLRGLIDRVDETDSGYVIWDYKTGSAVPYDESDLLSGGRHLQWALYAHAFGEILAERGTMAPIRSGYYFASDREHGRKMLAVPPSREDLGNLLGPVLRLAEAGSFAPVQKTPDCRFCDYKRICERDAMPAKAFTTGPDDDPDLTALATEWLSS